jgi:peroxiredoxin
MKGELLEEGAPAPAFELKAVAGGTVSLAGLSEGRPVLLSFFKVSCPVCQMAFPYLDRMSRGGGVRFVGISQDHSGAAASFASKFGVTFPVLLDEESAGYPVSNQYGISHVPSLFLVEPDGTISLAVEGFSKKHMLEIGRRAGVEPFHPGEYVPEWKAG